MSDGSDIPFDQRTQAEREEYFKRIADRLAMIGDQALADYEVQGQAGNAGQQRATQTSCLAEMQASYTGTAGGATGGAATNGTES